MYRTFLIVGLCTLAIIVIVGQLGRDLPDYRAIDRQRQNTQQAEHFPNTEKQQQPRYCYVCAISPADLSLSDMTVYGVTITNHSKNMVKEITFEVTMKECPPGYNATAANSDDQCTTAGQESKKADVFIPSGQARGFRSQMNLPSPVQGRPFFLWRIVSAKGMDAP